MPNVIDNCNVFGGSIIIEGESGGSGGGTTDYNKLMNLPKINNLILSGNITLEELGISAISNDDLDNICKE